MNFIIHTTLAWFGFACAFVASIEAILLCDQTIYLFWAGVAFGLSCWFTTRMTRYFAEDAPCLRIFQPEGQS
jgi:hypothetical protein